MAVDITLTDIVSLQNETTAIAAFTANNAAIRSAFQDALALDGTLPNSMDADLDMNSNPILNLPAPASGSSPLRLSDYQTLSNGGTIFVNNNIGVEYVIDGGGSQLAAGFKGILEIPFNAVITGVSLLGDQSGSIVLDIWKTPYSSYSPPTHPAVGDSITGSSKPTIVTGTKYTDTTLTGWTTGITANDVLAFNINSITSFTRLVVCLTVTKTT